MTEKRVALIIATDTYEDKDLRKLISPAHDAEALAGVLKNPDIGGFEVKTLLNETSHRIRREIEAFFIDRTRDDLLLLYFSCHGIKDEDGRLYYSTTDTDRKLLRATAIESGFVNDIMQRSRSRRQVLLLDCCYSGAFARGMVTKAGKKMITRNDFEGEGRGRVVLTASDAMQYSFEGDQVGGKGIPSVFTGNLVQGLKTGEADRDADGHITIDELYDYVHDRVVDVTPGQRPAKWNFGVQGRIVIARNPNPVVKPVELPSELMQSIQDMRHWVREGAVRELERILKGNNKGLALSALEALKGMLNDDSERVRKEVAGVIGADTKKQPESISKQEKPHIVESPTPVVETEHPQPAEKNEKEPIEQQPPPALEEISTAISTNITEQEQPPVGESDTTSAPVVETETLQTEKKAEKETIIQKPPRVSAGGSTAISKKKPMLLWLLPAILVPVISGIVVSIIVVSERQPLIPPPVVKPPEKIEEPSEPPEKVEKVVVPEIPKVVEKPKTNEVPTKKTVTSSEIKKMVFRSKPSILTN